MTFCLIIELQRLLLPRSSLSVAFILPRTEVISCVSIRTTPKFSYHTRTFQLPRINKIYFQKMEMVYYLKKESNMFHMKILIFMFLKCQNHLIKNTLNSNGRSRISPSTKPNDSSNLYIPYRGLGPTSIFKKILFVPYMCDKLIFQFLVVLFVI